MSVNFRDCKISNSNPKIDSGVVFGILFENELILMKKFSDLAARKRQVRRMSFGWYSITLLTR